MSVTGYWLVTALADDAIRALGPHFMDDLSEPDAAEMAWWRGSGGDFAVQERHEHWPVRTAEAERFGDLVLCACGDELWEAWTEVAGSVTDEHTYVASARKGDPTAALCYGLGPAATDLLPGRFGDFLLVSEEVERAAARVEQALAICGARREYVVERIGVWMAGMADVDAFDAGDLLDGPLRLFRRAAAEGLGLVSLTMWF